ncbi:glycosyltransferase [Polynucleobacter sp. UK-FUSCHL-C3]|uniref:Glycosyltransferase n=1 Tax=Polynucleobacter sp. UK-FUSCHL-C3 TaxID=2955208 RepID=A0AAU8A3Q2_9BURK
MEILFLTNRPTANTQAATVTEYLDALHKYSEHNVYEISMLHHFPARIDLDRFDVVISHYSLSIGPLLKHYFGEDLVRKLRQFKGLKAAFLQDEYREIKTYWKHINELGINVLFSCVPEGEIPKVYPAEKVPNLRVINVLTGYVPEALLKLEVVPVAKRPIDVGYRTRKMWYWLGALAYEKWFISEEFKRRAKAKSLGLNLDLSTREYERLYGHAWTNFVASCKTVIGVESGASIIDFDGQLERRVDQYVSEHPQATFEEVSELFLKEYEGSLRLHQISPRCFEAAALRTPMVLFEGEYSNVLEPGRHFVVLKKDFSNFEEVVEKIKDHEYLQKMADRTYLEVALNPRWSYREFIRVIDQAIDVEVDKLGTVRSKHPYSPQEFKWAMMMSFGYILRRRSALAMQSILLGFPLARKALFGLWNALPYPLQKIARPFARIISR